MSTQQETPSRSDMIRCEFCGEEYSVTYRKCPFCDDMAGRPAPRPTPHTGKGGKRQVGGSRGSSSRPHLTIEPIRIIGYALGLVLIVAAIYIVYTLLAPLFGGSTPAMSESPRQSSDTSVSVSQSQPEVSVSAPGVSTSTPDVSTPTPDVSTSTPDVSTPTPDVSTPAPATLAAGDIGIIKDVANIRADKPVSGAIKASSTIGSEVTIVEVTSAQSDGKVWYKIRYIHADEGVREDYIRSDFVDPKPN